MRWGLVRWLGERHEHLVVTVATLGEVAPDLTLGTLASLFVGRALEDTLRRAVRFLGAVSPRRRIPSIAPRKGLNPGRGHWSGRCSSPGGSTFSSISIVMGRAVLNSRPNGRLGMFSTGPSLRVSLETCIVRHTLFSFGSWTCSTANSQCGAVGWCCSRCA
jgi:hypothetical protein